MSKTTGTTKAFLCAANTLVCLLLSQHSLAEQKAPVEVTSTGDDYSYKFDDDGLLASTLANTGDIFRGRPRFQRVLLLRPRTDLRPHMYKSVENL